MGNKIRERRLEKGMSQDKLADLSGVDRVSISL
ncbi:MAG: helix-turn-helix transcriptional regulator, partial [Ruminococcus sp.]|nr:helix-turn-helix transcriptional regulator [Ruminococcus sp.]